MREVEEGLRAALLDPRKGWGVEGAYHYARFLEDRGRLKEAARVVELALREGPDAAARGKPAANALLADLEEAWSRIHRKLGVQAMPGAHVHKAGLRMRFTADWPKLLEEIPLGD